MRRLLDRAAASTFVRSDLRAAVAPWITARFVVIAGLGVSRFAYDEIGKPPRPVALRQGLFAWDAAFYRALGTHGYTGLPRAALRFFPLVPMLTRGLGFLLFSHYAVALLIIANASALVFGALVHRIALVETHDPRLARRAAWFGAVFPPFAVLVLGYADATAMALAAGVFLALRSRRWALAIPLGVAAGLCRPVGVLLVVPAVVEGLRGWPSVSARERALRTAAAAAPAIGMAAFFAYAGLAFDDPFAPLTVQNRANLRGRFEFPVTSLLHGIRDLVHAGRFGPGLHVVWAAVFAVLLLVIVRRLPSSYTWYAAVALVIGLSAHNLDSFERYCASTLPFLLGAAFLTRRPDIERLALGLAAAGLFAYSVLAFLGLTVP